MRIRTQNLIGIIPLFVGMALGACALMYSTARQEMLWGLREEASALGISIAEFVGGDALPEGGDLLATEARLDSLRVSWDRILAHGQAKYIFATTPSGEPFWSAAESEQLWQIRGLTGNARFVPPDSLLPPTPAEIEALRTGSATAILRGVLRMDEGTSTMTAYAPIQAADGSIAAFLGVVIDADRVTALGSTLPMTFAQLILVAIVIGTLTSLLISSLLTHRVRALSRAALEVAAGDYDRQIHIGTIQELSDLSNTFNTMSSVLKDLIERARRTLIEGEQFRTALDLARTYRDELWADLNRSYAGTQVVSRAIDGGQPGDLAGYVEREGVVTVYIGRVTETRDLESAITAAAAKRAIDVAVSRWAVPVVLDEVCRLLRIRIEAVSWRPGQEAGAELTIYGGPGRPEPVAIPLDRDDAVLLHTFPPRFGENLHRWKRVFRKMSAEELIENLARTLEPDGAGTLIAIGRAPMAAVGAGAAPAIDNDNDNDNERRNEWSAES